uniref:Uncharacterized protein n=1 Tax=Panagrolaimus davidi TaxID=227884 RepID=A0A914QJW6_9BILA
MGLYNAYNQYSNQRQPYQPQQQQPYQPPYVPSSASESLNPQQTFDQNQVLSAPIPPPTLVPSFLQDISPDDEIAAFESNSIIPISTSMPDSIFSPPPDPPANPFIGESKPKNGLTLEENSSELLQEFSNKCSKNGIRSLRDLSDCIDGVQYSLKPMHSQFGSNKCDFEPEFICRFYSSPEEMIPFKSGQFRVDPKTNKLFEQTFSSLIKRPIGIFPEGSFVYLDIKEDSRMHSSSAAAAILKTDILCQNGDGKLSFDYWTSDENITLKVCTTDENERSCTQFKISCCKKENQIIPSIDIPYDREAARIEVDVIHPQSAKFALEIVISNFTKSSIFIIDNLDFVAKLCEDSAFIPEATTSFSPQPSQPSPVRNQAFGSQIGQNFLPLSNQGFQPLNQASYHQNYAYTPTVSSYGSYVTAPPTFQPLRELPSPVFNNLRIKPSINQPSSQEYSHQGFPVASNNTSEISPGVAFVQNKYSLSPKRNLSPPKPMKLIPKLPIRPITAACELLYCKFDKTFCHWKVQEFHGRDVRYVNFQENHLQF